MGNVPLKIREERLKRNLTLEQLSEKTGISKSFLSQVERGKLYPSIASLMKIGHEFGVSVVSLFSDKNSGSNENGLSFPSPLGVETEVGGQIPYIRDIKIVRKNSRKKIGLPGSNVFYELCTPDLKRKMEVLYLSAKPGDKSRTFHIDPLGEKFCLVIKGTIEMHIGGEVHVLKAGDSIYYPSDSSISWAVQGKENLEMVLVTTPPWF
jgi:transcriptional regulator with XRE-family HTH domain